MRAQKITLAAVALAAGLSLTACQGDDSAAGKSDSGSSSSSSSSSGGSGNSGGSGGSDTGGSHTGDSAGSKTGDGSMGGKVTTGTCKTENLKMRASHGMGEGSLVVTFKNTGEACSLKGFAGVDLKADDGPGGISANRDTQQKAPNVSLQNGEETNFNLSYPRNDTGGSGVDITRLVVTPPNETHSKTVPIQAINIPVSDHSTSDVTVAPVGTGK